MAAVDTSTSPAAGGTSLSSTPPPVRREEQRRRDLRVMKQRATGLLVLMTIVFLTLVLTTEDEGFTGYLRAGAEASMIGGLVDWFAVTAIFRHPLGIPIPYTAVIRQRKNQFGETLGAFVQENFLSSEVVAGRVRAARIPERAARWMCDRDHADTAARHAGDVLVGLADAVRDDDVQRILHQELERGVAGVPVAALAARAVRLMTADQRHHDLLDAVLRSLGNALEHNRPALRERFGEQSPWWLPGAVEDRVFERLLAGLDRLLADVNANPDHELRRQFDEWVASAAERLESSPELRDRAEELKREFLEHPELRSWSATLWRDIKAGLREQAADPDSELRRRVADGVVALGRRLEQDPALTAKVEELAESAVRYVAEHFHEEIAELVSGTVSRWDSDETSDKLELLLGRDLQWIRINGTVVGALAGLVIHAVAQGLS